MVSTEYIQITHRELPYPTFDADNHLYENRDALTKFLPREYEGVVKYVEIGGRTKLAIRDKISDYIPNPTFGKVAVPGGAGYDVTKGGTGFGTAATGFGKMVAMPSPDAFFDPEPRLELMKEMGIDRTLLWPTLASALEERMADDPDAVCAVIHALNQWMHEHWSYVYSDAIYSTPIISLSVLERALEELEYVHERGAKIFLIRVAPVPTWKGRKSFALPEFDPFWERVQELDLVVGMHSGDSGYTRYTNEWEGLGDREMTITATVEAVEPRLPDVVVGEGQPRRRDGVDHRPRPRHPLPEAAVHAGRVRQWLDPAVLPEAAAAPTTRPRSSSTRTRSRCSTAMSGCTPSTSPTRRGSSISASPSTTSCSAPTSRTPRAWKTRSPTPRSSRTSRSSSRPSSWAGRSRRR